MNLLITFWGGVYDVYIRRMNRLLFFLTFSIVLIGGYVMLKYRVPGNIIYFFISIRLLIAARRHHLGLKPTWHTPLPDIPKYFKKP